MRRRPFLWLVLSLAVAVPTMPIDALAVTIRFDYRFDEGHISKHPERKRTLDLAAQIWGELLPDRFEPIPPGTTLRFKHPITDKPLVVSMPDHGGDLLVFIFASKPGADHKAKADMLLAETDGYSKGKGAFTKQKQPRGKPVSSLYQRANGNPFQPWAGTIEFNFAEDRPWFYAQSLDRIDDIPSGTHHDFLSTALHELGHILGFTWDDPFLLFADLVAKDKFIGPRTVALDQRPIPIDADSGHIDDYNSATWKGRLILARPNLQQYLMHGAQHPV